ncbi:MAG TPA: PAS domain-containing sensor histidine kinase [Casimicrobiaceae bacterium]|nr:PAS domain-containing sensor histidine kinase [Casimicrobiaceae bacterium]
MCTHAQAHRLTEVKADPVREMEPPMSGQSADTVVPATGSGGRERRAAPPLWVVFAPIVALLAAAAVFAALGIGNVPPLRARFLGAAAACALLAGIVGMLQLYRQSRGRQVASRGLRDAELRVTDIVEFAMDSIITIDREQKIVDFNRAAEETFGRPRAAVIGEPLDMLLPGRFRVAHRGHVDRFGRTGATARRMGTQTVLAGVRADGSEFPIEASISQHGEHGATFCTVILRDVTARVAVEAELRASRDELKELGAAAHMTREQETRRIARELHDELGQQLTMLQMDVAWCRARVPPGLAAKLERMDELLRSTIASTRRIASDLRPLLLDDLGLVPALEWLVQNFSQRSGIACSLSVDRPQIDLPMARASALFRIVQESLTNIAKHARATRVEVRLVHEPGRLVVRVRDDGVGLPAGFAPRAGSFGLLGMRERVSFLGGVLSITGIPGAGTTVEVHLPLVADEPTHATAAPQGVDDVHAAAADARRA